MKSGKIILIAAALMLCQFSTLYSQENNIKPRIAVKALDVSDPDNMQLKIISNRVTGNTKLLLKFMNEYELDSAAALSGIEEASMLDYCNSNNIDNIVYGKTYIGSDDSFVIEMSVYSREKQQTALTRIGRAETALDIFEASDNLTASIIEEFSGVHIAFGKIQLTNTGVPGSYIPYIDGEPFPEDSASIENLLIGKRTVEIRQMRMLGEYTVHSQDLLIKENAAAVLSFEIPNLLPAESEVINDQDKIISKNWDKLKRKEKVIKAFNEIDTILSNTPWNLSLTELKDEYKIKRAEYEANLVELGKTGKREFIVGATMGVNIGMINVMDNGDGNKDSAYNPIDDNKWNEDIKPAPTFGVNVQYQLFRNLYLQTELNYKDVQFYDSDGVDNYVKYLEIPVLLKLVKQIERHRFGMYVGPSVYSYEKAGGGFDYDVPPGLFTDLNNNEDGIGIVMGLEYGYKKDRHILTAGLRYSTFNAGNYSFFDPDDNETYDHEITVEVPELILGYSYNLGGNGNIVKAEDENKWLLPAEAGLMFMLSMDEDNTELIAGGGALRKITDNIYAGLRVFAFTQGGAPMLSMAFSKDPDKLIHNYSFIIFPMMGSAVAAFEYNIGIKRYSFGILGGGPLNDFSHSAIGFSAGYFF